MKPLNHACFEVAMADLLGRAYESFPAPIDLEFSMVYQEAKTSGKIPDHCPEKFDCLHSLYGSTFDFLLHEGILRASEKTTFAADGVVLTSKGFLVLNQPLEALPSERKTTLGQQFAQSTRKAGSQALAAVVSQTISHLIAALAK